MKILRGSPEIVGTGVGGGGGGLWKTDRVRRGAPNFFPWCEQRNLTYE